MATAAGLSLLFPRWRFAFYAIAAMTSAERFLETAHWFSDTVAAAALGIGGAHLLYWLLERHLFAAPQPTQELTAEQST
jgi:membrane-associated phospholipid phosphatase